MDSDLRTKLEALAEGWEYAGQVLAPSGQQFSIFDPDFNVGCSLLVCAARLRALLAEDSNQEDQ